MWQPGIVYAVRFEYHETWARAEDWDSAWSRDAKHVDTVEVRSLLAAPTPAVGDDDAMDTVANWRDQVGDVLIWDENCGLAPLPQYFWERAEGRSRKLRRAQGGVQPTTVAEATAFRQSERRTAAQPTKLKSAFGPLPEETQAVTEAFMREVSASLDGILASAHFQTSAALFAADPAVEVDSVTLALAHLAARIAATDAGVHQHLQEAGLAGAATTSAVAAIDVCHRPTGVEAVEELRKTPPFLRTFLLAFAELKYRAPTKRHEKRSALHRGDTSDAAIHKRALGLLPVVGMLFGSHGDWSDLAKLSPWRRRFAMVLMMDEGGLSERVFKSIKAEMAGLRSAREARRDISAASADLTVRAVLTDNLPPEFKPVADETPVICETTDNANTVRDHVALVKLGIGSSFTGWSITKADGDLMEREYANMPQVGSETVQMQALTAAEEKLIERTALVRDMQALCAAASALQREAGAGTAASAQSAAVALLPKEGDTVTFADGNGHRHTGKVTAQAGDCLTATYMYQHGSGVDGTQSGKVGAFKRVVVSATPAATSSITVDLDSGSDDDIDTATAADVKRRRKAADADAAAHLDMDWCGDATTDGITDPAEA